MKNKTKPPVPAVFKSRTATAETITKVSDRANKRTPLELEYSNTEAVSNSVISKLSSNEEILTLFPDIELSIQIVTSSIQSPNDLLNTTLNYDTPDFDIPNDINSHICGVIRSHIERNYGLESKMSTIIREALFTKGAYAEVMVPDTDILGLQQKLSSSLSTEAYFDSTPNTLSVFGDGDAFTLSVEGLVGSEVVDASPEMTASDLAVVYHEDMSILRVPDANMSISTEYIGLSTEALNNRLNSKRTTFKSLMRKKVVTDTVHTVTTNNESGSPMSMKLPIESVLPIHLTSDPSKHVGYLVLLDANGVPVNGRIGVNSGSLGLGSSEDITDIKASIISKASKALKDKVNKDVVIKNVDSIYATALRSSILNKVNTGKLGNTVDIPEQSDIYQTVFTRALKGLKTRILFVPKNNMNYFAFEYRDNGTGKSLLEKSVMLFSIRAANLFTRIMANVKNSVTTTKISAELDENDMDPESTREKIITQSMKSERVKYPMGMTNVTDFVEWMHNVGYRYEINHPGLPNIKVDISDDQRSIATPDEGFDEMIQDHIIMSFGLTREKIDSGKNGDLLATTVVANDVLFAKRVMGYQNTLTPQISGYVKSVLRNDGLLKDKLIEYIKANMRAIAKLVKTTLTSEEKALYKDFLEDEVEFSEYIYEEYISTITVSLPKVDASVEEGSLDGLSAFTDMLDTYLPMLISSDTLPLDLVGDISDSVDDIMLAIKTVLIKNWMADRNYLPEINKFLTIDNTGRPVYDIMEEYHDLTKTLTTAILPHLKKMKKSANATNAKLDKIDNDDGTDTPEDNIIDENNTDTVDDTTVIES